MLTLDQKLIISLDSILDEICLIFDVKPTDLISKSRKQELVGYRYMYYYLTAFLDKKQGGPSPVGRGINKDHTTVIHARNKIKDYLDTEDKDFMEVFEKYQEKSLLYKKVKKHYYELGKQMDYVRAVESHK